MNAKHHRHAVRADAADPRALAFVIALVGTLLGLTGVLRRSLDLEAVGRLYGITPPLSATQTIALGAAILLVSAGLGIWAGRRHPRLR